MLTKLKYLIVGINLGIFAILYILGSDEKNKEVVRRGDEASAKFDEIFKHYKVKQNA